MSLFAFNSWVQKNREILFTYILWGLVIFFIIFRGLFQEQYSAIPFLRNQNAAGILLTGLFLLLWLGKENLSTYHIDKPAIYLMTIAGAVLIIFLSITRYLVLIIYLLIFLKRKTIREELAGYFNNQGDQPFSLPAKLIVGLFVGFSLYLIFLYPLMGYFDLEFIIPKFIIELGKTAVNEEMLLRGFLWGFLKKHSWKETNIFLFQAVLFFLGHAYYSPVWFYWVISLIAGLVFGALAWKFRSVTPSIIAHAVINILFTFP